MNDERGVRKEHDLRLRTRFVALRIVKLYTSLPKTAEAQILASNYCVAGLRLALIITKRRALRSNAEFISKIEAGLQELEESVYWLNL